MIEFLAANWLWIAALVFVVLMHRGGHGCGMHGGHGHQHDHHRDERDDTASPRPFEKRG